ncbi:hypothetical protein [Robertkochia flava]|uniref:hypothetical protein n=1 Tax=Robertkochia flava TaxID=3447986 RepID=UPI001CCF1898|nr:hypothetical protein [Robertkochia marina]
MKNIILFLLGLILVSCSNNDDDGGSSVDFHPNSEGTYWIYEVMANKSGTDSLFVTGSRQVDGSTYAQFDAREPFYGLYTLFAKENLLKSESGRIYVRGELSAFGDAFPELSIPLDDLLILDPSASPGSQLDITEQEITIPYEAASLTGFATVRSEMLGTTATLELNGISYTNIRSSVITVTASAAVTGELDGVPITIPVLGEQEILRMELSFAEDTGLVYSEAILSYELSNTQLLDLPIANTYREEIIQTLLRTGSSGE